MYDNQSSPIEPIWESDGFSSVFGARIPFVHYELFPEKIRVTTGFFQQHTQEVPLYRIAAREINTNFIGRLFHCGKIKLIVSDRKVPDVYLQVKNPEEVLLAIDNEKVAEQQNFNNKQKYNASRRRR